MCHFAYALFHMLLTLALFYIFIYFFLDFSNNLLYTATCKVMQSKFMSVKCLPDGDLP